MKLKYKISIFFSSITAGIAILVSMFIYYYTLLNNQEDFKEHIIANGKIITDYFFEEDELSKTKYLEIANILRVNLSNDYYEYFDYNDDKISKLAEQLTLDFEFLKNEIENNDFYIFNLDFDYHLVKKYDDNSGTYLVYLNSYDIEGENRINDLLTLMFYENIITIILILIIGFIFSHIILQPFNRLIKNIDSIKTNELNRIKLTKSKDEVYQLSVAFNQLLDRIRTAIELQHNFISHASHEFKNPLTTILGETEWVLQKDRTIEDYKKSIETVLNESSKLEELTNELFKLADASFRQEINLDDKIDLNELIFETISEIRDDKKNVKYNFIEDEEIDAYILGNKELLKVAFSNIIDNCIKFSENPLINISVKKDEKLVLTIEDNGVGIPKDQLKFIFNPFFRASNVVDVKGFGIGMPLTKRIFDLHNFKIDVDSNQNLGTKFEISF